MQPPSPSSPPVLLVDPPAPKLASSPVAWLLSKIPFAYELVLFVVALITRCVRDGACRHGVLTVPL